MDKKKILLSIIVPVYNVEEYLKNCIKSIVIQEYKNLEIIIIDDGSTDSSAKICDSFKKYEFISVIHKKNGGVSSARNCGVANSRGEYVAFVDSDDTLCLNCYNILINQLKKNPNIDILVFGFNNIKLNGKSHSVYGTEKIIEYSAYESMKNFFDNDFVKNLMYAPWNKIYKKEILENVRFDENLRIGEDFLFVFECLSKSNSVLIYDKCLYNYYERNNSAMTSKFSEKNFDYVKSFEKIVEIAREISPKLENSAKTKLFYHYIITAKQISRNRLLLENNKNFYNELIKKIKLNKSIFFQSLSLKRKIDYYILMCNDFLNSVRKKIGG